MLSKIAAEIGPRKKKKSNPSNPKLILDLDLPIFRDGKSMGKIFGDMDLEENKFWLPFGDYSKAFESIMRRNEDSIFSIEYKNKKYSLGGVESSNDKDYYKFMELQEMKTKSTIASEIREITSSLKTGSESGLSYSEYARSSFYMTEDGIQKYIEAKGIPANSKSALMFIQKIEHMNDRQGAFDTIKSAMDGILTEFTDCESNLIDHTKEMHKVKRAFGDSLDFEELEKIENNFAACVTRFKALKTKWYTRMTNELDRDSRKV